MKDIVSEYRFAPGIMQESDHESVGRYNLSCNVSNGYYGYCPTNVNHTETTPSVMQEQQEMQPNVNTNSCDMDIQFNNYMEPDSPTSIFHQQQQQARSVVVPPTYKKRQWEEYQEDSDFYMCKKRRENDPWPQPPSQPQSFQMHPVTQTPQSQSDPIIMKRPTHNVPDLHRCMECQVTENRLRYMVTSKIEQFVENRDKTVINEDELFNGIHGGAPYHWFGHDI